jgi:hypothetical protein
MDQFEDVFEEADENYEDLPSFAENLYAVIAVPIKQFLVAHFGDRLNDAPAQTFRDIEQQIKEDIVLYGFSIPDVLYRHRTITDYDEWDKAFDNFVWDKNAVYPWPPVEQWYTMPDNDEEDPITDDEYADLPAKAQAAIDAADNLLDHHANFKGFMKPCCEVVVRETQIYLEKNAAFDLSILSADGYAQLQLTINTLAEVIAENLHAITAEL